MPEIAIVSLLVFLSGTLVAAFVVGLAGFAFGIVAAGIWLHALTPGAPTGLILAYAVLVQGYAVWKLRRALNFKRLLPFVAGSAVGIPAGILILRWAAPSDIRIGVGWFLALFGIYNLIGPKLPQLKRAGSALDGI